MCPEALAAFATQMPFSVDIHAKYMLMYLPKNGRNRHCLLSTQAFIAELTVGENLSGFLFHLPLRSARIHLCLLSRCPMLKEVSCNAMPSPVEWSLPRQVFPDRCTMPSWNLTLGELSKEKKTDFPSSLGLLQIQFTSKEYVRTRS